MNEKKLNIMETLFQEEGNLMELVGDENTIYLALKTPETKPLLTKVSFKGLFNGLKGLLSTEEVISLSECEVCYASEEDGSYMLGDKLSEGERRDISLPKELNKLPKISDNLEMLIYKKSQHIDE